TSEAGVFSELAMSLRHQSALLAIQEVATKEQIYSAYTHDLALLQRYHREFEACVQAAVRCSIMAGDANARQKRERYEETWQLLKSQIPSAPMTLCIDFPYTRAALPMPRLLVEMKNEFNRGVEQILKPLATWLHVLVANEFIGLVEWGDLDVCRYH